MDQEPYTAFAEQAIQFQKALTHDLQTENASDWAKLYAAFSPLHGREVESSHQPHQAGVQVKKQGHEHN